MDQDIWEWNEVAVVGLIGQAEPHILGANVHVYCGMTMLLVQPGAADKQQTIACCPNALLAISK
jgi:hypothetical protein